MNPAPEIVAAPSDRRTWLRSQAALVGIVALVVAGASYAAGRHHDPIHQESVGCLSTESQISCDLSDDWTIAVPIDVRWTDAKGVGHENGRPDCLPPSGIGLEGPVRLSWVAVEADGTGWRQVIAVDCRG